MTDALSNFCGVSYPTDTAKERINSNTNQCELHFDNGTVLSYNVQDESRNAFASSNDRNATLRNISGGSFSTENMEYKNREEMFTSLHNCDNMSIFTENGQLDDIYIYTLDNYKQSSNEICANENITIDKESLDMIRYMQEYIDSSSINS